MDLFFEAEEGRQYPDKNYMLESVIENYKDGWYGLARSAASSKAGQMNEREKPLSFEEQYTLCWFYIVAAAGSFQEHKAKESLEYWDKCIRICVGWTLTEQSKWIRLGYRFAALAHRQRSVLLISLGEYEAAEKELKLSLVALDHTVGLNSVVFEKQEKVRVLQQLRDLKGLTRNSGEMVEYSWTMVKACVAAGEDLKDKKERAAYYIEHFLEAAKYMEQQGLLSEAEPLFKWIVDWNEEQIKDLQNELERKQLRAKRMRKIEDMEDSKRSVIVIPPNEEQLAEMKKRCVIPLMAYANLLLKNGKKEASDQYFNMAKGYLQDIR